MTKNGVNPKVEAVIQEATQWREEFETLRGIILAEGLKEELRWGKPCYTLETGNVVLIQGFKGYCALLFPKGALLKDGEGILIRQTENVQAARQIRFTSVGEIARLKSALKAYLKEAIAVEKAGLKVQYKSTAEFPVPAEFETRLKQHSDLKKAFAALTPGRQRGYLLYFAGAKQPQSRAARVEKCVPRILNGKGLDDD